MNHQIIRKAMGGVLFGLCLLAASPATTRAGLEELTDAKAAGGLKEALSQGTVRAVELLGKKDGFLANKEVRIEVPRKLRAVEQGLELVGREELVEEFVTSMNRAAEAAAPVAKEVFLEAVKKMTFEDARAILRGDEHAATDYLEKTSRPRLFELFRPVVSKKLDEVGATAAFQAMIGRYGTLPFADEPVFDLEAYVTDKGLDGLFHMIAKEEARIRTDVVARGTDLLKEVFGAVSGEKKSSKEEEEPKRLPWWKRF